MCKKHYNDYDHIDMKVDMNYKTEQFIKKVIESLWFSVFCYAVKGIKIDIRKFIIAYVRI